MASGNQGKVVADIVTDGQNRAVFVKELRVMLLPDDGHWFAKGLDIDYFACGSTIEEAKNNFAIGLALTINEHLVMFNNLDKVNVPAGKDAWEEYAKTPPEKINKHSLSLVMMLQKAFETANVSQAEEKAHALPYDGIQFVTPKQELLAA